jgi:hypothetical protein
MLIHTHKRLDPRHGCCKCYKEEEVERISYTGVDLIKIEIRSFFYRCFYSGKENEKKGVSRSFLGLADIYIIASVQYRCLVWYAVRSPCSCSVFEGVGVIFD